MASKTVVSEAVAGPVLVRPLYARQLASRCHASGFSFSTTADLADIDLMATQERARAAIELGADVSAHGFNVFVVGSTRNSVDEAVKMMLKERAKAAPPPGDWVYLNNFVTPHRPIVQELPAGRAPAFHDAMRGLVEDLQAAIPTAFESEEYQARQAAIDEDFSQKQENAFKKLQKDASTKDIAVIRTPVGFTLAPVKDGKIIKPNAFAKLPDEERARIQTASKSLEEELKAMLRSIPLWDKERRVQIRQLNQETTRNAVADLIDEAGAAFSDLPSVREYLDRVRTDLIENMGMLLAQQHSEEEDNDSAPVIGDKPFGRYDVNVFVTRSPQDGAPVVEELHPTLANLVGRVEHIARHGVLATDFRLIKPGALHRANGGYLLLDTRAILSEPFAWPALKRALKAREIQIENAIDLMSLTSTITLQPDPIPLKVTVVLFGERLLYNLLSIFDPEFSELFKILADFEDVLTRNEVAEAAYARLIATIARKKEVHPLDRDGVARVIERSARIAGDAAKLTLIVDQIGDLLVEADFWARKDGKDVIGCAHVACAVDQQILRMSRIREGMQEAILRDIALIKTTGSAVGQINGLSVAELGGFVFGRPSRITARVSPGSGRVVDIEREVELGGPIHSKGVLILSGFLSGNYALDAPISLFASLVFEQSYGGVEGDSASSAELFALLSALADVPLRQDLAVTGSVNQHGAIQAIGAVNEKIEGFFDVCKARGLTGMQGVLIPAANVQHLMLRDDVVSACEAGQFSIYAVSTIDEGIALLTGRPAGVRAADGAFRENTINRLVEERLKRFAQARRAFARDEKRE